MNKEITMTQEQYSQYLAEYQNPDSILTRFEVIQKVMNLSTDNFVIASSKDASHPENATLTIILLSDL